MSQERERLRALVRIFDELIRIPGTNLRFGLDPLLGILPGGDALGGLAAAYTIVVAGRAGAPRSVIARMLLNVLVDTVIGTIPFLGDVFDVGFKANRRNVALLEEYLRTPGRARRSSRFVIALAVLAVLIIVAAAIALAAWLTREVISLF